MTDSTCTFLLGDQPSTASKSKEQPQGAKPRFFAHLSLRHDDHHHYHGDTHIAEPSTNILRCCFMFNQQQLLLLEVCEMRLRKQTCKIFLADSSSRCGSGSREVGNENKPACSCARQPCLENVTAAADERQNKTLGTSRTRGKH